MALPGTELVPLTKIKLPDADLGDKCRHRMSPNAVGEKAGRVKVAGPAKAKHKKPFTLKSRIYLKRLTQEFRAKDLEYKSSFIFFSRQVRLVE